MGSPACIGDLATQHAIDDYSTRQTLQVAHLNAALPAFVDAISWPAARLTQMRETRLRKLLSAAKRNSPWHAKRMRDIDTDQVTLADLAQIPPMTKADLMNNFDEIVADSRMTLSAAEAHLSALRGDAFFVGDSHVVSSGGSSGTRGVFTYDWDSWIAFGLSSARPVASMLQRAPAEARERAVAFVGDSAAHSSAAFAQSFAPWIVQQFGSFVPLSMALPFSMIVERLNHLRPTCLSGYPSLLHELCFAVADGRLRIKPKAIIVGAEPLFPEQRAALVRTFNPTIMDFYGCSEASCIGFSCAAGSGLHLCDDTAILEPVDHSMLPALPGVPSAGILVTNLFNPTLPLIRYVLDDSVVPISNQGPCVCGSAFQRVHTVEGRADDVFRYDGGIVVHPFLFRSALGSEPAIIEYQVVQTTNGADIHVRAAGPFDRSFLAARVADALRAHQVRHALVSIVEVNQLQRTPAGKMQRFVPLPRQGTA